MSTSGRAHLERIAVEHGARISGDTVRIRCPVHQGKSASLTIKLFPNGFLVPTCWGNGCSRFELKKCLGIEVSKDPPPICGVGGCKSSLDSQIAVYANPKVKGGKICSHREDYRNGADCWRKDCFDANSHKHLWGKGTHSGRTALSLG